MCIRDSVQVVFVAPLRLPVVLELFQITFRQAEFLLLTPQVLDVYKRQEFHSGREINSPEACQSLFCLMGSIGRYAYLWFSFHLLLPECPFFV